MTRREVEITDAALFDLFDLDYTIKQVFQAPLTAKRYVTGLKKQIQGLSQVADLKVVLEDLSKKYGKEIRRDNYKEMAILFSIEDDDKVYVHRIIPQKMVKL